MKLQALQACNRMSCFVYGRQREQEGTWPNGWWDLSTSLLTLPPEGIPEVVYREPPSWTKFRWRTS